MKAMIARLSFCILLSLSATAVQARQTERYEQSVCQPFLEEVVNYLADDMMKGRASGTFEKCIAEQYIRWQFKSMGLKPYNWSYTQSCSKGDTLAVRNVVGCLPASVPSDSYIIVSAHYDHLGTIAGKIYNGADDNASGVAALLAIARMFCAMREDGAGPGRNIIFVAFDGKEMDMAGSRNFVRKLAPIRDGVICNVNLDMLGTDLVPPGRNGDYLIFLGEERLPDEYHGYAAYLSRRLRYRMDLDQTFYGSRDFADFYYGMSDQRVFAEAGIPAVTFTSAFHKHTYKPTDDAGIINFPLLLKRTRMIFNYIARLCE